MLSAVGKAGNAYDIVVANKVKQLQYNTHGEILLGTSSKTESLLTE